MHDNLSILKAVTRTTYSSTPSMESNSPPSPIAPLSGNSGDQLDFSFAFISAESIDLAVVRKEQEEQKRKQHLIAKELETHLTLINEEDSQKRQNETTTYGSRYVGVCVSLLLLVVLGLWMNDNKWIQQNGFIMTHWHRLESLKSLSGQTQQWLYDHYYSLRDFMRAVIYSVIMAIDQRVFYGNLSWVLTGNRL